MIDCDDNVNLTVDPLLNIITASNITLRKVNVKPYGFDETFMDKYLIADKLYESDLIDQFNERIIKPVKFD